MLVITPDIINNFNKLEVCKDGRSIIALEEHKVILQHIIDQEPDAAAEAMRNHLKDVLEYSQQMNKKK